MKISRRSTLLALPMLARAALAQPIQPGPPRRIGLLVGGDAADKQALERELGSRMEALGWRPGTNLRIEGVYANGNLELLPALAEELVRRRVDIIVSGGARTSLAAARATQTIPIVFLYVHYPVEQGLVQSYSRPSGNVTGPALFNGMELTTKRIEFLRDVAPTATRLAWVWPIDLLELPTLSGGLRDLRPAIATAGRASGFQVSFHAVHGPEDLDSVFRAIVGSGAQVLAGSIYGRPEPITDFALRQGLPSAYPVRYFVAAGGLISYGLLEADMDRTTERAAAYVDRILRGARPSELAVEQPSRYELALNAKTAKALAIKLPASLMLRADAIVD